MQGVLGRDNKGDKGLSLCVPALVVRKVISRIYYILVSSGKCRQGTAAIAKTASFTYSRDSRQASGLEAGADYL